MKCFYLRSRAALLVNKRSVDVIGYRPEIIGCHVADFVRSDERDKVYRIRPGLRRDPKIAELPVIHKNGSERIIRLNVSSFMAMAIKLLVACFGRRYYRAQIGQRIH